MKKNTIVTCLILAFFLISVATTATGSPPDHLLRLLPSSVKDLTNQMEQTSATRPGEHHYIRKTFAKPGAEPLGPQVPIATTGYTTMVGIYYMLADQSFNQSNVKADLSVSIKNKFALSYVDYISVGGYPVVKIHQGARFGKIILETKKGKYYISIYAHFRDNADKGGALSYAKAAMAHVLSRISSAAPADTQKEETESVTESDGSTSPYRSEPKKSLAEQYREKKRKEDQVELDKMRAKWDRWEAKTKYYFSEEYKQEQEEKRKAKEAKEESIRQSLEEQSDFGSMVALMYGEEGVEALENIHTTEQETIICGGEEFVYYPDTFDKRAKKGETYVVAKWKNHSFLGYELYKLPIMYKRMYYVPVAYVKGGEITGYLWMDQGGRIAKDVETNRALFTYMYVFGFNPYETMKNEIAYFKEDAQKNDEEIKSYANYKDAAKILKVASNAMGVYIGVASGGMLGMASAGISSVDAAVFLVKMNSLENATTPPDLSTYENLTDTANTLENIDDLAKAVRAARNLQKLNTQIKTLKSLEQIKATKAGITAARTTLVDAAASLGWAIFEHMEATDQIAEQAAMIAVKFTGLKYLNLSIAKIYEDAQDGINDETEAKNIFLLNRLKAKHFKLKGDLIATMLKAYEERKTSVSGYIGRFSMYLQGKSIDEHQAQQAIHDAERGVDLYLNNFYDAKINIDVTTGLTVQRATL